jgi:hypothetical protein
VSELHWSTALDKTKRSDHVQFGAMKRATTRIPSDHSLILSHLQEQFRDRRIGHSYMLFKLRVVYIREFPKLRCCNFELHRIFRGPALFLAVPAGFPDNDTTAKQPAAIQALNNTTRLNSPNCALPCLAHWQNNIPTTLPSSIISTSAKLQWSATNDHKTRQRADRLENTTRSFQSWLTQPPRFQSSPFGAAQNSHLPLKARMTLDLWREILFKQSMPATEAGGLGNLEEMPVKWAISPPTS